MHYKCRLWFLRVATNHALNMWGSISGFNYEHHCRSKVIHAGVVKGKSCMCCSSKGRSSLLSSLQFLGWLLGCVHFFGPSAFLEWSLFFSWSSFLGSSLFLVLSPFFGCFSFFWVVSLLVIVFDYSLVIIFWGKTVQNVVKLGHTGPNGGKQGQKGATWGNTGPNKVKWDT